MTRYLGEEGDRSRLSSALVMSCVSIPHSMNSHSWANLSSLGTWRRTAQGTTIISACILQWSPTNSRSLSSTFLGRNLWLRGMGWNLFGLVKRHRQALSADPDHPVAKALPSTLALRYPRMHEFDAAFTKDVGDIKPPFPFPTVGEYYQWASSDRSLRDIKVPFLALNSADDPVVISSPVDGGGNPNVVMALTRRGGHLGWFHKGQDCKMDRWTTKPVIEWLKMMGEEVVHEDRKVPIVYVDKSGYLKELEMGREQLGCKEIEGGGVVTY